MILPDTIPDVGHAIQLALAPVFLLTGVAALLGVMTNRLARIIDRARQFEDRWSRLGETERAAARVELLTLERRRRLSNGAINACTFAALMICVVVTVLFLEVLLGLAMKWLAGLIFIAAMLALIAGLSNFLREVHLAMRTVRILTQVPDDAEDHRKP